MSEMPDKICRGCASLHTIAPNTDDYYFDCADDLDSFDCERRFREKREGRVENMERIAVICRSIRFEQFVNNVLRPGEYLVHIFRSWIETDRAFYYMIDTEKKVHGRKFTGKIIHDEIKRFPDPSIFDDLERMVDARRK